MTAERPVSPGAGTTPAWRAAFITAGDHSGEVGAVSYTHLTLPTNREV